MGILFIILLIVYLVFLFFPLFLISGAIFQLDTLFLSFSHFSGIREKSGYWFIRELMTFLFGYQLWSKIFMVFTILLGVYLIFLWTKSLTRYLNRNKNIQQPLLLIGSLFSLFSPFFYERITTQAGIYLAFLMIGYGLYFLFQESIQKQQKLGISRNILLSCVFLGISWMMMPHAILMIGLIIGLFLVFFWKKCLKIWFSFFLGGILIVFLNINRLIGTLFLGTNIILEKTTAIDKINIEMFATTNLDGLGAEMTGLLQYGFRGEWHDRVTLPGEVFQYRYRAGFLFLFICVGGLLYLIYKKKTRRRGIFLISLFLISWMLGVGISSSIWGAMIRSIHKHIPLYNGMRDAQKWIGVMMLVEWVGFIVALGGIFSFLKRKISRKYIYHAVVIGLISLLGGLLYIYNPHAPFMFSKHILITERPKEYFEVRKKIESGEIQGKILVLPRHSYMYCERTEGKTIVNAFDRFVGVDNIIVADNIEIGDLYTNNATEQSKSIEQFIKKHDITILQREKIKHIVLLSDCEDAEQYDFLNDIEGLDKNIMGEMVIIYSFDDRDVEKMEKK